MRGVRRLVGFQLQLGFTKGLYLHSCLITTNKQIIVLRNSSKDDTYLMISPKLLGIIDFERSLFLL